MMLPLSLLLAALLDFAHVPPRLLGLESRRGEVMLHREYCLCRCSSLVI